MYEAPARSDVVSILYQKVEIEKIQWKAGLRYISNYRSVSIEAVCVLARTLPLELITEERAAIYKAVKKCIQNEKENELGKKSNKCLCFRREQICRCYEK